MKQPYAKPGLTLDQQIELMKSRGMAFPDEGIARRALQTIGYYRLSGYWYILTAEGWFRRSA